MFPLDNFNGDDEKTFQRNMRAEYCIGRTQLIALLF